MKIGHETTESIENYLNATGKQISFRHEDVFDVFMNVSYERTGIWKTSSKKRRDRMISEAMSYTRRDLLLLKYKQNGYSAKGIKEGHVYAITNPAWGGFVKIGCAIDVFDRLNSYQTSSPHRDYKLEKYIFSYDRMKTEQLMHDMFSQGRLGEWCECDITSVTDIFKNVINSSFSNNKETNIIQCYPY